MLQIYGDAIAHLVAAVPAAEDSSFLHRLSDNLGWVVAIIGGCASLFMFVKRLRTGGRAIMGKIDNALEVLNGRPEIRHPETDEVLVPETPGIGTRMAHVEMWQEEFSKVISKLADIAPLQTRVSALERRMDIVEARTQHQDRRATDAKDRADD